MKRLLLFPIGVILLSILILKNFENKNTKKIIDDGFLNAKATESNKYVCNANNISCVKKIVNDIQKTNNNILLLGNSQLGAINNFKEGEINFAHIISLKLKNSYPEKTMRSIWLPNATLNEFKVLFETIEKCSKKNHNYIIPLFLDDTREIAIRESLKDYSEKICGNYQEIENNKFKKSNNATIYKRSEEISEYLLLNLPIIKNLEKTNLRFKYFIYQLRNSIFNIKPSSNRRIIPSAYKANINSLKKIMNSNKKEKLLYIPPLLFSESNTKIPYKISDYKKFKTDLERYCNSEENCSFYNLESSVPNDIWGKKLSTSLNKNTELDFMHFTYKGHLIFSEEIIKIIKTNKLGE